MVCLGCRVQVWGFRVRGFEGLGFRNRMSRLRVVESSAVDGDDPAPRKAVRP